MNINKLMGAITLVTLLLTAGCTESGETVDIGLDKNRFVQKVGELTTDLFVLNNNKGMTVAITNFGGRVVSLVVPDKNGNPTDVVLGYDNIADYLEHNGYFGTLIGRYGNRIGGAQFTLGDKTYQLPQNDSGNCLHGGPKGFHNQIWTAKKINKQTLELVYLSKDGEEGFPGNLEVKVVYSVTADNALDIQYEATTDQTTVVNLTHHSYFNLSGVNGSQIADHLIQINADNYTPVDSQLIPTGEIAPVEGTPLDLRQLTTIGTGIDADFEQITLGGGYDHNWMLNTNGDVNQLAAKAVSPVSGIALEVFTTEPGIQFYSGNMDQGEKGKGGVVYPKRGALCLETQHFPDSPNQPNFPTTTLQPGEKYTSRCIYKFSIYE